MMKPKTQPQPLPLCHRCEHRAVFLETGHGPRYECQQAGAVASCYMFRPVIPLVLHRDKGDRRGLMDGCMWSARAHAVGHAKVRLRAVLSQGGTVLWQEPFSGSGKA